MGNEPKISIITPCYNHGKYIREMLESVYRQTFEDYEVIVVNDGSTDNTREVLEGIVHEKVKIIHIDNYGPAYARNLAIENAQASIIMNLDADDKIAPDLLEKAYNVFCVKSNIGIVHSDAECFGAISGRYNIEDYTLGNMLFDNRIISQAFFRKEDWALVGGYSSELIYGLEDWDFWLLIIELGRDVVKISEPLVYYRTYKHHNDCRTGRLKRDRIIFFKTLLTIYHRHEKLYAAHPMAKQHFLKIENKLKNENILVRQMKNYYFRHYRKII
jgi:glycosyltransferase involved in cell wall biosynthesis